MPDAIITSTASTFGTISGTFAADQSTVTGTVTGIVAGTLSGSVGVPGPAGPGVPAGGTAGQYLQKIDGVDYNTDWVTLNLSAYAPLNSPAFTGNPTAPTAALGDNDTSLATTAFVQQELLSGTANAKNLEVYVRNQTGSTLAAGAIVYINGATGNRPTVTLAQANNDANSAQTMGFVKTAIANNGFGYVIVRGEVEGLDTQAVAEGTQLYLSPTVAGAYTTTKPSAPQHLVYVGIVIRSHPTQGVILVAVQNGYELNELHDVSITSPTNGQVLKYDSATNLWVNGTDVGGVAWGGITGTLSDQTDLQSALNSKYSASNPAGYITSSALSGYATESWVTSQGYATTASLSGYALLSGASFSGVCDFVNGLTSSGPVTLQNNGYLDAYGLDVDDRRRVRFGQGNGGGAWGWGDFGFDGSNLLFGNNQNLPETVATRSWVTAQNYITSAALSPYLTSATAASTYFTIASAANKADLASPVFTGDPQAPTPATSDNDTSIATTAFVKAQGYLTSAPVTSVAGKTGAVTLVVGDVSGAAPLASPTFTGTPSLPTGTTAVTQSPGDNTTAVATTAFVQTSNPDASTTTKGHVELATVDEALRPSSSTLGMTPETTREMLMYPGYINLFGGGNVATSGTGSASTFTFGSQRWHVVRSPNATVAGYGMYIFDYSFSGIGMAAMSRGVSSLARRWNHKIWVSGRTVLGQFAETTSGLNGDANCTARVMLGGRSSAGTGGMQASDAGIGWRVAGGGSVAIVMTVSNGTTLTETTSSFTPVLGQVFDWKMYSDGTGNVTLWVNDSQVATSTGGPTTSTAENFNFYCEVVEQTASAATPLGMGNFGSKVFWSPT